MGLITAQPPGSSYFCEMIKLTLLFFLGISTCSAQSLVIVPQPQHFRNAEPREWSEFPMEAKKELRISFTSKGEKWQTLSIRQRDVRQSWKIFINKTQVGSLMEDEKDITHYISIPPGTVVTGTNSLRISTDATSADDIVVGEISLYAKIVDELLSTCRIAISVLDKDSETSIPARITILDKNRSMAAVRAFGDDKHLAVRPGCVYTSNGWAQLTLPAGRYTFYVTRGFEYGVDSASINLTPEAGLSRNFFIRREVDTRGWIASDTHVHTFTHSGHGDATDRERTITLAGEGIELPIITDHNLHVDLGKEVSVAGLGKWFTPVIGNEVTTKVGHFNVFSLPGADKPAEHRGATWNEIASAFRIYSNEVIILNHANDIHQGFRPFDPSIHLSAAGYDFSKWAFLANAMEVMNSGSQQTGIMMLFMNWFGMINGGKVITPIGSSDSHDVSRYIVGQGRTYIQGKDDDAGKIDVPEAVRSIRNGRVMVSSGLLTKIVVNGKYGPGDLVPPSNETEAEITVTGPSWATADRVMLFANGELVSKKKIKTSSSVIKWTGTWKLDTLSHDVFLVAIATGPGNRLPFWPIEKPYQPASPDWTPKLIGASGAVWLDGDGNGQPNTANLYAGTILRTKKDNIIDIVSALSKYDKAVAIQVAVGLWADGKNLSSPTFLKALESATPATKAGFEVVRKGIQEAGK